MYGSFWGVQRKPIFECGVCGVWTQYGDFLSMGRPDLFGDRECLNFVCYLCQHEQRRALPPRPRALPDVRKPVRVGRDLPRMYAAA